MSGSSGTPAFDSFEMVFRARQRREIEELQQIDRQLALDHVDIVHDRFERIVRESENVAGIGQDGRALPGQQHLAVFGDLVLPLLGAAQVVRVDVLEPDEHALDAGARIS